MMHTNQTRFRANNQSADPTIFYMVATTDEVRMSLDPLKIESTAALGAETFPEPTLIRRPSCGVFSQRQDSNTLASQKANELVHPVSVENKEVVVLESVGNHMKGQSYSLSWELSLHS